MTHLVRRAGVLTALMAVALMAFALSGTALAKKVKTDQLEHCKGASIKGEGSTFQAPAEKLWTGANAEFPTDGFNVSSSSLACKGSEPTVAYEQKTSAEKGSGSCLKNFGASGATPKVKTFAFCGTDEAPPTSKKEEMETHSKLTPEKGEGMQSIPVLQGAVAVIVHLPKSCTATSEPKLNKKTEKIGRLSLENTTVDGIYDGTITTWEQAIAAQKSGVDKITCTEEEAAKLKDRIHVVVRLDKSGTTHIFKKFLAQVSPGEFSFEPFFEINEGSGKEHEKPCGEPAKGAEPKSWESVSEGCENQRWPAGAEVTRPTESGNPGVVNEVAAKESSIGYADLAVARELGTFSKAADEGGEGTSKFWTPISNSKATTKKPEYADPATNGDVEALGDSNCSKTVYAAAAGEKIPPKTTRLDWSKVRANAVSKTYGICGITYVLVPRLYWGFEEAEAEAKSEPVNTALEEESKKVATTVSNYLEWVLSGTGGGGGEEVKGHDYEPLPKKVLKVAEAGAAEIGSKEA